MSQSVHAEHEIVRDADRRSPAQQQADAKSAQRRADLDAPIVERVRNVGGRLMA
jgi:hypothetical protein